MRPDGTNERLFTHGGANIDRRFSPDSKQVLYTGYERGSYKAWTVEIQGGKRTEIYHQEKREVGTPVPACWSRDGKRIAMIAHDWERTDDGKLVLSDPEKGNYRILIMDAQGQNSKQLKLKNAHLLGVPYAWMALSFPKPALAACGAALASASQTSASAR
jgi:Tol biopolymer transport system component